MAAKMAIIVGDVTGRQQRHRPQYIPHSLVKKIKGFPLKVKSFRNTTTYQKLHPSLAPLYHGGGINLRVRPRVKVDTIPAVNACNIKVVFAQCKGIRSGDICLLNPVTRENFACVIRNPLLWNPEYSSRNPESHR